MPWYDYSCKKRRGRDNKRRKRGGGGRRDDRRDDDYEDYVASGKEHPLLSQGLRSGRSGQTTGYTVEELEAERNAKNAEIITESRWSTE